MREPERLLKRKDMNIKRDIQGQAAKPVAIVRRKWGPLNKRGPNFMQK